MRRALALAAAMYLGASGAFASGAAPPPQPFEFNHKVHAGEEHIGCTSCHVYAERGPVAGVPSMARCQGCHKFVKEDKERPRLDAQLKALSAFLQEGKAVEWRRVHRLPDHVVFTHEKHVVIGHLQCRECHGAVEEMETVRQVSPLTMGWCLECHHRKKAPADCWTCHK